MMTTKRQNQFKIYFYFCLLVTLIWTATSASAEITKPFLWADDEAYAPLIYRGADGKPAGLFYEIMTTAFQRMNIPLQVKTYPWVRAQKIVTDGKADGMVTVLTDTRKMLFVASEPIIIVSEHIFLNQNNPRMKEIMEINSIEGLKSFKLVETIGSGWTKENLKEHDITWVPDMNNAFNMLIKQRVDIFVLNDIIGADFINKKLKEDPQSSEDYKNIIINPFPLKTIKFRLLIRKNSYFANKLDDFNKVINQMQIDGTIQNILKRLQLPQIEHTHNLK